MILIIARLPISELDRKLSYDIVSIALEYVFHTISTKNIILGEYSITLLLVILRRINNLKVMFDVVQ